MAPALRSASTSAHAQRPIPPQQMPFTAPEVLMGQPFDASADVWSFGELQRHVHPSLKADSPDLVLTASQASQQWDAGPVGWQTLHTLPLKHPAG